MSRVWLVVCAGLLGLVAAAVHARGLVDAVPLVDWNSTQQQRLRDSGAQWVRIGCVGSGAAGLLLLAGGAWRWALLVVILAVLLAVLAEADTLWAWPVALATLAAVAAGCVALLRGSPA